RRTEGNGRALRLPGAQGGVRGWTLPRGQGERPGPGGAGQSAGQPAATAGAWLIDLSQSAVQHVLAVEPDGIAAVGGGNADVQVQAGSAAATELRGELLPVLGARRVADGHGIPDHRLRVLD